MKKKKKLIILLIILFIILIAFFVIRHFYFEILDKIKPPTTKIIQNEVLEYEYKSEKSLLDTITIIDGEITTQNYMLDTNELGNHEIEIKYKNSNGRPLKYKYNYNVVDTKSPYLAVNSNLYITTNTSLENVLRKSVCGDNYDRDVELTIEGDYDLNKVGNYNVTFVAKDDSQNTTTKNVVLHVYEKVDYGNSTINNTEIKGDDINFIIKNYKTDDTSIGIDLSEFNSVSDFNKVKEAGIEFVMLRLGWGPNEDMSMNDDKKFEDFYTRAKEANLRVGVYLFSYSTTLDEVDVQINYIKDKLKDKEIDLWVSYDWESWNLFRESHMNFYDLNDMARKFMDKLKENGYKPMNYGSLNYLKTFWDLDEYDTWLAQYFTEANYDRPFKMWQITDTGIVDGINGVVDVDIIYNKN